MGTIRVWLTAVTVLVVAALVLGVGTPAQERTHPGAVLGPDSGELVSAYLQRSARSLRGGSTGEELWALLAPTQELTPVEAAQLTSGVRTSRVLLRVPVPRVQTALVALEVADQRGPADLGAELTDSARRAAGRAQELAAVSTGRQAAVAALSAARLAAGCACVVGLVLRGTAQQLSTVAGRAGVRSVQAAPAGTSYGGLAVTPLLPEQTATVGPGPDDGHVPAS